MAEGIIDRTAVNYSPNSSIVDVNCGNCEYLRKDKEHCRMVGGAVQVQALCMLWRHFKTKLPLEVVVSTNGQIKTR